MAQSGRCARRASPSSGIDFPTIVLPVPRSLSPCRTCSSRTEPPSKPAYPGAMSCSRQRLLCYSALPLGRLENVSNPMLGRERIVWELA